MRRILHLLFISLLVVQSSWSNGSFNTKPGEGDKDLFQVIPNPDSGAFNVIYKSDFRGQIQLAVIDALGKYVFLKTIRDFNGEYRESVELIGNPKGIYVFEIERDGERQSKKVIFQ
jgi:hypothetical protein